MATVLAIWTTVILEPHFSSLVVATTSTQGGMARLSWPGQLVKYTDGTPTKCHPIKSISNISNTKNQRYIRTSARIRAAVSFESIRSPAVAFNAIEVSLHFDRGMYFAASSNNGRRLSAPWKQLY